MTGKEILDGVILSAKPGEYRIEQPEELSELLSVTKKGIESVSFIFQDTDGQAYEARDDDVKLPEPFITCIPYMGYQVTDRILIDNENCLVRAVCLGTVLEKYGNSMQGLLYIENRSGESIPVCINGAKVNGIPVEIYAGQDQTIGQGESFYKEFSIPKEKLSKAGIRSIESFSLEILTDWKDAEKTISVGNVMSYEGGVWCEIPGQADSMVTETLPEGKADPSFEAETYVKPGDFWNRETSLILAAAKDVCVSLEYVYLPETHNMQYVLRTENNTGKPQRVIVSGIRANGTYFSPSFCEDTADTRDLNSMPLYSLSNALYLTGSEERNEIRFFLSVSGEETGAVTIPEQEFIFHVGEAEITGGFGITDAELFYEEEGNRISFAGFRSLDNGKTGAFLMSKKEEEAPKLTIDGLYGNGRFLLAKYISFVSFDDGPVIYELDEIGKTERISGEKITDLTLNINPSSDFGSVADFNPVIRKGPYEIDLSKNGFLCLPFYGYRDSHIILADDEEKYIELIFAGDVVNSTFLRYGSSLSGVVYFENRSLPEMSTEIRKVNFGGADLPVEAENILLKSGESFYSHFQIRNEDLNRSGISSLKNLTLECSAMAE